MTSGHLRVSNSTMLGIGGSLGFNSNPIDHRTSLMVAFKALDMVLADTSEVLQSKLELGSMQL